MHFTKMEKFTKAKSTMNQTPQMASEFYIEFPYKKYTKASTKMEKNPEKVHYLFQKCNTMKENLKITNSTVKDI